MTVLLIALNFVREQRWFILLVLLYLGGLNGVLYFAQDRGGDNEVRMIVQQEAYYALFFSVVTASAVFQNERKTRRILAVLSKAVSRAEYVAGIVLGVNLTVGFFLLGFALGALALLPELGAAAVGRLLVALTAAALLTTVVTVFYATFLHPLLATAAAALTLALSFVAERVVPGGGMFLPVYPLMRDVARFTMDPGYSFDAVVVTAAVAQALAVWLAASWVFAQRDITAPVE